MYYFLFKISRCVDWQGFVEALARAEACAMVFHGYTEGETNVSDTESWSQVQDCLSACFSGCIEVVLVHCSNVGFL